MTMVFLATFLADLCADEEGICCFNEPMPCCEGMFFLEADFLYWKARQQGLDVFSSSSQFTNTVTVDTATESIEVSESVRHYHRLHFDWRCGVRIGAGYTFANSNWDLLSRWTYFHGHGHVGKANIKGKWNLTYNVLDVLTRGPQFYVGSSFRWKAFGGVRAARIDQKLNVLAETSGTQINPFSNTNLRLSTFIGSSSSRSNYKGIGPEFGFNTAWSLPKKFGVYADAGGSLLYSHYDAKFSDEFNDISTSFTPADPPRTDQFVSVDRADAETNTCQVVLDLALGISWQSYDCFCPSETGYLFKLGWEHSQWFNHNAVSRTGDLCFDGLVFSAEVQF
jgi:hypothetical protein